MSKQHKLMILDDDIHYTGMFALKLQHYFPELRVSSSNSSDIPEGYDIYIVDNDFDGEKIGADIAEKLRTIAPNSLVIVLSGTLEKDMLVRLVNCHTAGVFDKTDIDDFENITALIEQYLKRTITEEKPDNTSFVSTISNIKGLLSAWNKRLSYEQRKGV